MRVLVSARTIARLLVPPPLRSPMSRLEQRLHRRRFLARRSSPTDYLINFEYRSARKAKASILWYDDWRQATGATVAILDQLGLVADGSTIVDYGCGVGRVTRALVERYRLHVLAVDRSAAMRKHAERYIPRRYQREGIVEILSDVDLLERQPVLGRTIDSIVCIEVLQHIPEPILEELLPRLLRMLKPSGRLFVLGNELLDVDRFGRGESPIAPLLARHAEIDRTDSWSDGFARPRGSFVCVPKNSADARAEEPRAIRPHA